MLLQEGKIDKRHGDPDDPEGRNSGQKAVGFAFLLCDLRHDEASAFATASASLQRRACLLWMTNSPRILFLT